MLITYPNIKDITYTLIILLAVSTLYGCSQAKDILYLEDIRPNVTITVQDPRPIKLQPGDRLTINVFSRDKELVEMFNLSTMGASNISTGTGTNVVSYTVDDNGIIEMPIIGSVHVKGMTRMELQNSIRYRLLASKLVRDPIVNVEFVDIGYYVLGEMTAGKHPITTDNITLLQAISECGDMSIMGRRDNIMVLRTVDGQQTPYFVNITSVEDLYSSPVYYLQQNDVIYVQPNETAINASSPNGSAYRTPGFWISMFNLAMTFVLLFSK